MISLIAFASALALAGAQFDAHCATGRTTIVHLFEWRWDDIARECEDFLGPKGYCGVQVSPPNEYRIVTNPPRPWWERYQPVSYETFSRSGNDADFKDMVSRCNKVNVRVYVDVVLNHMASGGPGNGTKGSTFNGFNFPSVPYTEADFNSKEKCNSPTGGVQETSNSSDTRNCPLLGLPDLDQSNTNVKTKLIDWLNRLIDDGVAGFRVDAAKHMWPGDLKLIFDGLKKLPTSQGWFATNAKPFIYQEVTDLDDGKSSVKSSEYYEELGRVTEFNYGIYLSNVFTGKELAKSLSNFGQNWHSTNYPMPSDKALVFIDNHDNQRGHGTGEKHKILNFFTPREYQMAVTFMLAWPYGQARVMSSYYWDRLFKNDGKDLNDWVGPPHFGNYTIRPVITSGDSCGNGWICEHRWKAIRGMVLFRNAVGNNPMTKWWDDGANQIAFSRGTVGFFALNAGTITLMNVNISTGLKPGRYCDVISGEIAASRKWCSGQEIVVNNDGNVLVTIDPSAKVPIIAIHSGTLLRDMRRTVIFMKKVTGVGDYVFLRGGIDVSRRSACNTLPSACYIPIEYSHVSYTYTNYLSYNEWSKGDNYLDWDGKENGQGTSGGKTADGSPMTWTTNDPKEPTNATYNAINSLNNYGPHHWMLDVMMDCSFVSDGGWFEVKGRFNFNIWEKDTITQDGTCSGTAGGAKPFSSKNHIARCGYKNIFEWDQNKCQIDNF